MVPWCVGQQIIYYTIHNPLTQILYLLIYIYIYISGIPLLDIFFGVFAARNYKLYSDRNINLLQAYISYIISTLGGSMCVSYLLSQPVGWLQIDIPFLVYTATFLLFHIPLINNISLFITNNFIVQLIIQVFVDITWMTSITSYSFDNALKSPYNIKNSSVGPIIVAFIGGMYYTVLNIIYPYHI